MGSGDGISLSAWFFPKGQAFGTVAGSGPVLEYDNGAQIWVHSRVAYDPFSVAWLDPTFRAIASDPLFVIAAWAATRPNVTKSFAESASRLRKVAMDHVHTSLDPPDHRAFVEEALRPEDAERLVQTVRALHHGLPKVYLVVQAWARLARRQRIPGTGREEVPARRGIPTWQEGVLVPGSASPESGDARSRRRDPASLRPGARPPCRRDT